MQEVHFFSYFVLTQSFLHYYICYFTNTIDIFDDAEVISKEVLADGTRIFSIRVAGAITLLHYGDGTTSDEAFEEIRNELIDENEHVVGEWEEVS